jgi:hypothetical protein
MHLFLLSEQVEMVLEKFPIIMNERLMKSLPLKNISTISCKSNLSHDFLGGGLVTGAGRATSGFHSFYQMRGYWKREQRFLIFELCVSDFTAPGHLLD